MIFLKKAISLLLVFATLLGCCTLMLSCKPKDKDGSGNNGATLNYGGEAVVDFANVANITGAGLSVKTDDVKTSASAGSWDLGSKKTVEFPLAKNDLSSYKEISVWINNKSSKDVKFVFKLMSDNGSTNEKDCYQTTVTIHPGWHEYKFPFSELDEGTSKPIGFDSVTSIVFDAGALSSSGNAELIVDSVYGKFQKTGTLDILNGFKTLDHKDLNGNRKKDDYITFEYAELANALCFYEDSTAYLYNQLRYVLSESNSRIAVTADTKTTYIPVSVVAQHRGATELVASAEKVSFKYNGNSYEFTADSNIQVVGTALGIAPGQTINTKPMVIGDYIMIPMEKCAEIFGYQLFYDKMGLVILSDKADIYDSTDDYDKIYNLIEKIAYSIRTGEELVADMNTLYPEDTHTRILLNQSDFDRLKKLKETDPVYSIWFRRFEEAHGKKSVTYTAAMPKFELGDGYRLLEMSRDVMNRLIRLSFLYKMTDDEDYADKVYDIMYASITRFQDPVTGAQSWHPEHFLDTGELMYGYSIGYDWCYDTFDDEQRQKLEDGIIEVGFGAALGTGAVAKWWNDPENLNKYNEELALAEKDAYSGYTFSQGCAPYNIGVYTGIGASENKYKKFDFNRTNWINNWSAVCNGGITAMALAFANAGYNEETKEFFSTYSKYLLDGVLFCFHYSLEESYATDGGYPEGPGYWSYGTTYTTVIFAALESATGASEGMTEAPGFRESFYYVNAIGSLEKGIWNYHDSGVGRPDTGLFFWFAERTGDTAIGKIRYQILADGYNGPNFWDMMWYNPDNLTSDKELPLDYIYHGIDTVVFRSDWSNNSLFCGLHGGANAASHGQLDIGNFILEYGGTRFFVDLGSDEYNLVAYGKKNQVTYFEHPYRYWFYRMKAEGHNTLVINPMKVDTANTTKGDAAQSVIKTKDGVQYKNYDQRYSAVADIIRFESNAKSALAVIDFGPAYIETMAGGGVRGMYVADDRSTVIIQDELSLSKPTDEEKGHTIYWMAHTENAEIKLSDDKKSAIITIDGKSLSVSVVLPEGSDLEYEFGFGQANYLKETGLVTQTGSGGANKGEYSRQGYQRLYIKSTGVGRDYKIAVVCRLLSDGPYQYTWTDIKDWKLED